MAEDIKWLHPREMVDTDYAIIVLTNETYLQFKKYGEAFMYYNQVEYLQPKTLEKILKKDWDESYPDLVKHLMTVLSDTELNWREIYDEDGEEGVEDAYGLEFENEHDREIFFNVIHAFDTYKSADYQEGDLLHYDDGTSATGRIWLHVLLRRIGTGS